MTTIILVVDEGNFHDQHLAWDKALPLARPVREQVFVAEQKVPLELEWDEWDERSDHAVARDSKGQAIGTARLLPTAGSAGWRYSANGAGAG